MPKPQYNEIDKECTVCGSIIWGKGQRILLEGAKITVCHNCAQHGVKIQKSSTSTHIISSFSRDRAIRPKRQALKKPRIDDLEISRMNRKQKEDLQNLKVLYQKYIGEYKELLVAQQAG